MNEEDERLQNLHAEKQDELDKYNDTYDRLIEERNQFTQQQQGLVDQWEQTQKDIANQNLQYQQDLYNQEKQKAEDSYQKEARASYVDYQKEVDKYGVSRENVAANGLSNSGYAESSKVDMYNTYQNRVATARESLNNIKLEFDNAIKEAIMANNATLAQNALQALQQKLDIALEGFNYKDTQTQNKLSWENEINNNYYNREQDVLDRIERENQQKEAIRQWEEEMKLQREQLEYQKQQSSIDNSIRWAQLGNSGSGTTLTESYEVNTPYYKGDLNPDVKKYGAFGDAGYQPKGISGHGKLKKSGDTVTFNTQTLAGQKQTVTQNVWVAEDGTKWYWDGRVNKYLSFK